MTLSFACPDCGKTYRNVKQKLIGKKARCSCGKVIRIGGSERSTPSRSFQRDNLPANAAAQDSDSQCDARRAEASPTMKRSSRSRKKPVPTVDVQVNQELVVDDHYNDLDELLAANNYEDVSELVRVPDREIAIPAELVTKPPAVNSVTRSSLALVAAIAAATIAFWFGLLVVMQRLTQFDNVLLSYFQQTYAGINSASFGDDEITSGLRLGFIVAGWTMWAAGLAMGLLAVGQLLNALVQLFIQRQLFRWADGLMATLSIVFVFLAVSCLFLHASHMTNLNRELNKVVPAATANEFVPANVQRIRDQYNKRNRAFTIVMLVSAAIPMTIFTFSMTRLFATAGDTSRS